MGARVTGGVVGGGLNHGRPFPSHDSPREEIGSLGYSPRELLGGRLSQGELPAYHVARARLVALLASAPVAMVEAPGGWGKSVLAAELRAELGIASATVTIGAQTEDAAAAVAAFRRGLQRSGLTRLSAPLPHASAAGDQAPLTSLVGALSAEAEPVLIVVDEVHRLKGAADVAVAGFVENLPHGHRTLLLGRRVPPALDGTIADTGAVVVRTADLAFDAAELRALCRAVIGKAGSAHVAEVARIARGWPAAAVLAARRLVSAPETPLPVEDGPEALAALVGATLAGAEPDIANAAIVLAHLPLLDDALATAVVGTDGVAPLRALGLPLSKRADGWLELSAPLRAELSSRGPLDAKIARRAAAIYAGRGELPAAIDLLQRQGDRPGVAQVLSAQRWQDLTVFDPVELEATLSVVPDSDAARHLGALIGAARAGEAAVAIEARSRLVRRALDLAPEAIGHPDGRQALAEHACDLARDGEDAEAERLALGILGAAGPGEDVTRARALQALGRLEAWRGDDASLAAAGRHLTEAAGLFGSSGEDEWRGHALASVGYRVHFGRGDLEPAIAQLQRALATVPGASRERAVFAVFLGEVLGYVGHLEGSEAALDESGAIARVLGDERLQAYTAWQRARNRSFGGDLAGTEEHLRDAEAHPGEWFAHPTGIEFLGEAAEMFGRLGRVDRCLELVGRTVERAAAFDHPEIGWFAEGQFEARFGDPERADELLRCHLASEQQTRRDEWRTHLFIAHAAARRDDPQASELALRAFAAVHALGYPQLPFLQEADVSGRLAELSGRAGPFPGIGAGETREPSLLVRLLGGFELLADGRPMSPPAGHPQTLVKLVAMAAGPVAVEQAAEELWPSVDEETGRRRLRNVLNRLKSSCGEVVVRDGEMLALAPGCAVDARLFVEAARLALAAATGERAGLARSALSRYRGELLPEDPYAPWAASARERLRRRQLELLDSLVADARERGDLDEAVRLLDEAIAAEPLDEERYLQGAEMLLAQGRRGSARGLVERAEVIRRDLGLLTSPRLERLKQATRRADREGG